MRKKKYRKVNVHPSLPSPAPLTISNKLSLLPATILTLTVALSPEDKEVLAYLISCSSSNGNPRRTKNRVAVVDHPPMFRCRCFRCYISYWARWDSSPNLLLIHEIIDAFEDSLAENSTERKDKSHKLKSVEGNGISNYNTTSSDNVENDKKGSVRRFLSYIREGICELLLCLGMLNRFGTEKMWFMSLYFNRQSKPFYF